MGKQVVHLTVTGMTCQNCVSHVTKSLDAVPGVKKVKVELAEATATVTTKADVDRASLVAAVKKAGYDVTD